MMPDKDLNDEVLDEIIAGAKTSMEQYLALSLKAERAATHEADGNSPVIPDGYALVPIEPTEKMLNAWLSEVANWRGHVTGYKAMLSAAPQPG